MFFGFGLPVLEYCSAVWCSAADTHLNSAVSGALFLTRGVFECDIAHRWSVAVLCLLYKIRCNPMHPLYGAIPVPYAAGGLQAALWSHIGILIRLLAAELRSTAGHLFISQFFCGTMLTLYSMVWDWRVSRAGPLLFIIFLLSTTSFHPYLLIVYRLVLLGWCLWTDRVYITISQPCTADLF